MLAHARAARRCFACGKTCFAAALELPKLFSKSKSNAKAAAKQVATERSDSDALRAEGASALSAVFPNQFGVHPMKHNLGAKPVKEVTIYLIDII